MRKEHQCVVAIADEILSVMERHVSAGSHSLDVVAAVGIACKLFAIPSSDRRKSLLRDPESVSELRESAPVV